MNDMEKKFKEEDEVVCACCHMEIDGFGVHSDNGWIHKSKRKCKAFIAEEKAIQNFQDALQRW